MKIGTIGAGKSNNKKLGTKALEENSKHKTGTKGSSKKNNEIPLPV